MNSTALTPVPIPGTSTPIMATEHEGKPFVPLRPMCDALGLDSDSQRRKLDQAEWAVTVMITATGRDGKTYKMAAIDADHVPMWLATIQTSRVNEASRGLLVAYQREAASALRDYFYRGVAVQSSPVSQLDILRGAIDAIEEAQRTADEAKQLATNVDDRLAAIEGRHEWYSALGYARSVNHPNTSTTFLNSIGRQAAAIARHHGIEPAKVPHQLFGKVNSFPAWVWEQAFEGRAA